MDMVYTLRLTVTRSAGDHVDLYERVQTDQWMTSARAKRELEREVLRALRVIEGDCDIEVMETEIV